MLATSRSNRLKGIALASAFAALTAASAGVSIPILITPVPVTLQVFFVLLALSLAGPWYGGFSMVIYLFLGAAGLPVFAGYTGGVAVLLGQNGGYRFAFPVAAFIGGFVAGRKRISRRSELVLVGSGMLLAVGLIYLFGVLWLSAYLRIDYGRGFLLGALPFIPVDLLKLVVAVPIGIMCISAITDSFIMVSPYFKFILYHSLNSRL